MFANIRVIACLVLVVFLAMVFTPLAQEVQAVYPAESQPRSVVSTEQTVSPEPLTDPSVPSDTQAAIPVVSPTRDGWDWQGDTHTESSQTLSSEPDSTDALDLDALEIEISDADFKRLERKSDAARAKAMDMINHAMPILADQLNAMSASDQRALLSELEATMTNYFPPSLQDQAATDPSIEREGWRAFMAQLEAHGYRPPH